MTMNRSWWGLGVLFALAIGSVSCKGGAAPASLDPKVEACNTGCDTAQTECTDKCKEEGANKDACELACKAARDKCAEDCKKS